MNCLRCGHCCIHYDVIILIDPDKGLVTENTAHKPTGEKCMHLLGDSPGNYSCGIHDHPIYAETPCAAFTQIEHGNTDCRIGVYVLNQIRKNHDGKDHSKKS